jgi:hypothetical protein
MAGSRKDARVCRTGKRSAVRNNSGEPVDHSGPGLGVGPTTPPTAGRTPEACPSNFEVGFGVGCGVDVGSDLAISQHKSGQGSGDGVPGGASEESAVQSAATQTVSSLDVIQINRYTNAPNELQKRGRKRHCGSRTIRGLVDGHERILRLDCRTWDCAFCGPRKAWQYKQAISAIAKRTG